METTLTEERQEPREPRRTVASTALTRTEADVLERFARDVDMTVSALLRESALRVVREEQRVRRGR